MKYPSDKPPAELAEAGLW